MPGPLNDAGSEILPTGTYTWWFWNVTELTSLSWTLNIDKRTAGQGYFWSHEFYFADGGGGGYVGLQDNGDYQASPDAGLEITQMVLFSVAGGALQATLGDFQPPVGEVSPGFDGNVPDAFSIHAEYPWSICETYQLRLWVDGTDAEGDFWLAASITDPVTQTASVIGRVLISAGVGGISPETGMWTEHWQTNDGVQMSSCAAQAHSSTVFGYPIANESVDAAQYQDDFGTLQCPTSRFTILDAGIRQEMGVGGP